MKNSITNTLVVSALLGFGINQIAEAAVTEQQANELFNLAEQVVPQFFNPAGLETLTFPPEWQFYRGAYANQVYVGINLDDSVYVVGGSFGVEAINVGSYGDTLAFLQSNVSVEQPSSGNDICSTNDLPEGVNYTQKGNVVTVTTEGCIIIPEDQNFCESTDIPQATGISVLSEINVLSSELAGVTAINSAFLDAFDQVGDVKTCTINAAEGYAPSTVNMNICLDVTTLFSDFSSIPGLTITPPVTQTLNSTQNNGVVSDCFTTGADIITDNLTGETFLLQPGGNYLSIPNI